MPEKTERKRKVIVLLGVVALIAVGFYALSSRNADQLTYRIGLVSQGDIVVNVSATGTLNPVTTVQVGSQVSGTIARLYADYNDVVKQGELLAQLDPTFLQASVNEQRANVSRTSAEVREAERNFSRISELFEKTLVSPAEMDAATTSLESARASLQQAEASLERAEVNLRYATIRSPIDGVVISRDVDVGQTVAASLQAPTLFTIARDLRKMQVEATVDEADIGNVREGHPVTFRVDAHTEDIFRGVVSQVRLGPTLNQNVVTYTVIIAVENPELKLMPGMTATVTIEVNKRADVLRVPIQAVRFRPSEELGNPEERPGDRLTRGNAEMEKKSEPRVGHSKIWVLRDGTPSPVSVVLGLQDFQFAELVQSDLAEGDEVIVGAEGGQTKISQAPQNPFQPQMPTGRRRGGI